MTRVNKSLRNILTSKALRSDEHQEFINLANLLPATGRATVLVDNGYSSVSAGFVPETVNADEAERLWHGETPAAWEERHHSTAYQASFEKLLNDLFPVEQFPEFRNYLKSGDPRRPELATPRQRWDWIATVSKALRARAEARGVSFPWAKLGDWKPTGVCVICNKLFSVTRRDKTTCSDGCANIHYQRQWRERKKSGKRKSYYLAWKKKQAKKPKGEKG
jgi:hypothetical protein